ncbi:MAG: ribonuclease III [Defluviitaleaceae bacterium]|nr:ribonuclease III [Defluviitaleaceae bacterium]
MNSKQIDNIENIINYKFKDKQLLSQTFTHSSYIYENEMHSLSDNERLEFLGDAVLQIVISRYLYDTYKSLDEGELTKLRASIVCEPSLAIICRNLNLGNFIAFGKGEEKTDGKNKDSNLADLYEAIIGAIYLDGSIEESKKFIDVTLIPYIDKIKQDVRNKDYKTELQELLQKTSKNFAKYVIIEQSGPDHDKTFTVEVLHGEKVLGKGIGKSKKDAEQNAAKVALENM